MRIFFLSKTGWWIRVQTYYKCAMRIKHWNRVQNNLSIHGIIFCLWMLSYTKSKTSSRHQGRKLRARSEIRLPTPLPPAIANCSVRTADAIGRRWARVRQKRGPEGRKTWLTEAGGEHPLLSTAEAKKRTVEAEEIRLRWKVEGQAAGGCLRVLLFCYLYSTLNQTWLSCDMLHRTVQIKHSDMQSLEEKHAWP